MKKLNVDQGSTEWLKIRKNKIGASDATAIMGVSPWRTPYQLWSEKMGLTETQQNDAMRRGIDLEPIAREKFFEITGIEMFPLVALHDAIEFMMASFDGISANRLHALEIKCPGYQDHEIAMDGIIPEKYIPQLQHQMEVAGINSMFYFSYSEKSYKMLEIERNDKYIKDIIEKEKKFWECMQNFQEPELIDRDYIKKEDEEWKQSAKELIEVSNQLLLLEERKEKVRKKLIELSGNMNCMGEGIKLSKIYRKGTVDYKSIPELNGLDLEKYRKPSIETYRIGVC